MRKIIIAILALFIIGGAFFGAKTLIDNKKAPKPKIKKEVKIISTDTVVNATVPIIIPANGNLQAKRRVELFSEVTGVFKPTGTLFKTGQEYSAGQTMIIIENSEFYAQVQSARSNLNNQITAIMPDLRLDYPNSYAQWQSYLNNWDRNASTPQLPEPKDDKEKYFITGRNIYTTYYNIKNLESRLGKFRIKAPFTGVLTEALVTEGSLVRNGQQLGEFIQTGTYELEVAISGEFADLLKVGKEVELQNITGTKTYIGKVTRINGKIDQQTQTITTVIEVSDKNLKDGMYLTANLQAQQIENAIELDRSLLQDGDQLFVVHDTLLELVSVQPVHFSDKTVVVKGVDDGTVIISKMIPGAYEGMIVKTEQQAAADKQKAVSKSESK
ncbi:efflux RND transporter periplasmic adaptor subunit [Nonlabens sp.]|uniref:efflux RND transporter periplasmic adaptor subunit n=1 Tax=Nonlabens sp. TaxID=1888209 RepID=UPI003F6A0FE3